LEVFYAQRDFFGQHRRWAANLAELGLSPGHFPGVMAPTPDGYTFSVPFTEGSRERVWRIRQDRLLNLDEALPVESELFIDQAANRFGEAGRKAADSLLSNMPAVDRARLSCDYLTQNLTLAFEARKRFPWAAAVPEPIFLNDVLPYASLDEGRDLWRAEFGKIAGEIAGPCRTASEAALALNREIFNRIQVHYNPHCWRSNQGPMESISQGKATVTGLSIILVDACRSVGIPARVAGAPAWADKDGNYTWVEIWDGDWFFMGPGDDGKEGLNPAWFTRDASRKTRQPVYASSWQRTGQNFPLAWDPASHEVPAVNVSARYATPAK
jgi:transglutaminase-like putative cysteine protease